MGRLTLCKGQIFPYADDTALLFEGESWEEVMDVAERGLLTVKPWFYQCRLTVNITKTKCMPISIRADGDPFVFKLRLHTCGDQDGCVLCECIDRKCLCEYLQSVSQTQSSKGSIALSALIDTKTQLLACCPQFPPDSLALLNCLHQDLRHLSSVTYSMISVEQYFVSIKQELSYRKPLPILGQRSKVSPWCVALLYFRVLPLHFSKHKNSIKTNMIKLKLNSLLKKHSKLVFILDHTPPPKVRVPCLRADVNERKTSLEIVPISKISNSRGSDQKYKLNCNGKAIMYRANHVMPRGLS
ncbi:hypothetical protein J6590_092167 [Homalodisca vitripennis]|nr:hypothetical protein J6590_092167 [Homalodisca vitripennis]